MLTYVASADASHDALSSLMRCAAGRKSPQSPYLGELFPVEVFAYLQQHGGVLVDVRTVAEWKFVGEADLTGCRGTLASVCWKQYPDMQVNPSFEQELAASGATKDTVLFFMCRGGGRSSAAATAMTQLGYRYCFNIATGFEGEPDPAGHRGRVSGWQGAGLPWKH